MEVRRKQPYDNWRILLCNRYHGEEVVEGGLLLLGRF